MRRGTLLTAKLARLSNGLCRHLVTWLRLCLALRTALPRLPSKCRCAVGICCCVLVCLLASRFFALRNLRVSQLMISMCTASNLVNGSNLGVYTDIDTGEFMVSGKVVSSVQLDSPLKVSMAMERAVWRDVWLAVPCLHQFGSCQFADLCQFGVSDEEDCPPKYADDAPCMCPVERGNYSLPLTRFSVGPTRWASFIVGNYKVRMEAWSSMKWLGCYNLAFIVIGED